MKIIAVAGTPGTGKTALAKLLAKKLNANLISINILARKIPGTMDKKRKTKVIDIRLLQKAAASRLKKGLNIIEGHPSHLLRADIVIVLRTDPVVLKKRLKKHGWDAAKIRENVEAEMLDVVTIEALEKHRKGIIEVDTTGKTVSQVSKPVMATIERLLKSSHKTNIKFKQAGVNWSGKYTMKIAMVDEL
ncbi:MAG: adenylate kinase family protein [Candidatus Aenigmarchaeota archaeon]|nr:adenylate kinase family protein [Candidatus Aenigmarchaeota archaeon]